MRLGFSSRAGLGWILVFLAAVLGCGYSAPSYRDSQATTIAVPIFENKTLWRGREFELTYAITKNIMDRTPYRVASKEDADLILEGEILDYQTPGILDDRLDRVLQSSVSMHVNMKLSDKAGKVLIEKNQWFAADFSTQRGESEATARAEATEKAARWVVTCLQTPW